MKRWRIALAALLLQAATAHAAGTDSAHGSQAMPHPVYELRQYTLHPGKRDTLVALFENRFIEPLERDGMQVVAHFRDLDNPDRFVWFRRFDDMDARGRALPAFYLHDPVWRQYRNDAKEGRLE